MEQGVLVGLLESSNLQIDLAELEKLLSNFRRTVVVPDARLAHLPGETPSEFQNVAPVRLVLESSLRHAMFTDARILRLKQSGRIFSWTLPSGRSDSAVALTSEVDKYVS